MSVLNFKGYRVLTASYERNSEYDPQKQGHDFELQPELSAQSDQKDSQEFLVRLRIKVRKDSKKRVIPFKILVDVEGDFVYHEDEDSGNFGVETFLQQNAVAILYPYVRSLVSNLTNMSNEFPGYNMPTINVSEALKAQKPGEKQS